MRLATWLCQAGLLSSLAILFWTTAVTRADEPVLPPVRVTSDLIDDVGQGPKFWLDMKVARVPEALDKQLQLDGKGALVLEVGADGPADKAGVKAHDILISAADRRIEKLSDVLDEVEKADGKTVTLKVLRAGQEQTLSITPEQEEVDEIKLKDDGQRTSRGPLAIKRRLRLPGLGDMNIDIEPELAQLESVIREKLKDAGIDVRLQLIQPGRFVPRADVLKTAPAPVPDDLTIDVHKQGNNPAEIEIKQGDQSWTIREDQLSELPPEVRQHVEALLGHGPMRFAVSLPGGQKFDVPLPTPTFATPAGAHDEVIEEERVERRARPDRGSGAVERQLDEMSRQMERIRDRMEDLRRNLREREPQGDDEKVEDAAETQTDDGDAN